MGTRLIAFIGTGDYDKVSYTIDGPRSRRCHLPAAAICELLHDESAVTSVVFVGTREALKRLDERWSDERREMAKERSFEKREIERGDQRQGRWGIFDAVLDLLQPQARSTEEEPPSQIVVDITHGFRAQSFLAGAAVSLALADASRRRAWRPGETLKAPKLRIFYAAHDEGDLENPDYAAELWDLSDFAVASQWIHALTGVRYGRGDDAALIGAIEGKEAVAAAVKADTKGTELRSHQFAKRLGDALRRFADDLATVRVGGLLVGSGGGVGSVPALLSHLRGAEWDSWIRDRRVLRGAFDDLRAELDDLMGGRPHDTVQPPMQVVAETGLRASQRLAAFYVRLQRYSEAFVVARETLVSLYSVRRKAWSGLQPGDSGVFGERKPQDDELAGRGHALTVATRTKDASPDDADELVRAVAEGNGLRNDVEHAGHNDGPAPAATLRGAIVKIVAKLGVLVGGDTHGQ